MGVKSELRIRFYTQFGDRCGQGDALAKESDTGDDGRAEMVWCANYDVLLLLICSNFNGHDYMDEGHE